MIALSSHDRLFVLTGAGVSAESGIPTFRGPGGLWEGHRIEEVATPEAWQHDPWMVWRFYSMRRQVVVRCQPNPAHRALAELEQQLGDRLRLCTQNVDDLHERAGSERVWHMHGQLFRSRCDRECGAVQEDRRLYSSLEEVPRCACGGRMRPHICWFGEIPFHLDDIAGAIQQATVFLAIGTSGVVYPAAALVHAARSRAGTRTFYVGLERPANASLFDEVMLGPAAQLLPGLFRPG